MLAHRQSLEQAPFDLDSMTPLPADCSIYGDSDSNDPIVQVTARDTDIENDNNDDSASDVSDCESSVSAGSSFSSSSAKSSRLNKLFFASSSLLTRADEEDRVHRAVKQRFLSGLKGEGDFGSRTEVVSVHRRNWSVPSAQASVMAFQIHAQALARKHGGEINAKYAWFGTSKIGVEKIVSHGFGHEDITRGSRALHGQGVYLSPVDSPLESVQSSAVDDDGLKHVLLCRVLIGKMEPVNCGSGQIYPSSDKFDSGVDDIDSPRKYIVWSSRMNTHILPEMVLSVRVSSLSTSSTRTTDRMMPKTIPKSPWMSFPALIAVLSKILPRESMSLISKKHKEFKERRITRSELVKIIRQLAGDKLLKAVIKSCQAKGFSADRINGGG